MTSSQPLLCVACLTLGLLGAGCQCAERSGFGEGSSESGLETSSTDMMTATSSGSATTTPAMDDEAKERFLAGVFHNENYLTPFGGEGPNGLGAVVANVEFRADGTGTMWVEECCTVHCDTNVIQWKWSPLPGPWVELTPGEGEDSLRFFAWPDVQSLRATIDEDCTMFFEWNGEIHISNTFRLGRACWVVRCEGDTTHVDYCEGETIPECP